MDEQAKKTALRTITYGLYILGASHNGEKSAACINWLTQASFAPPLVAIGVKKESGAFAMIKESRSFTISFLEAGQGGIAGAFFKPTVLEDGKLNGYAFTEASSGAPIISDALSWVEGKVVNIDETGDHAVVIGEVTDAGVHREGEGLPLKELGAFYGG